MAKYVIDLDSFIQCLDMISAGKLNGHEYTYLQNVKAFIERFPKHKVEETVHIEMKSDIKVCEQ